MAKNEPSLVLPVTQPPYRGGPLRLLLADRVRVGLLLSVSAEVPARPHGIGGPGSPESSGPGTQEPHSAEGVDWVLAALWTDLGVGQCGQHLIPRLIDTDQPRSCQGLAPEPAAATASGPGTV